jgi:hypothetical protein
MAGRSGPMSARAQTSFAQAMLTGVGARIARTAPSFALTLLSDPWAVATSVNPYFRMRGRSVPQIEISTNTLARLKKYAEPLEDTYDTIINKFGDAFEALRNGSGGAAPPIPPPVEPSARACNASDPPDLTYTKILSAKLNGATVSTRVNWNGLLKRLIQTAKTHAKNEDDLHRLISVNFVLGRKEDEGYEYLPNADLSVQGQDTNAAWKGIVHLSQQLGVPVDVVFLWRHKPKAAFPGKTGRLVIPVDLRLGQVLDLESV